LVPIRLDLDSDGYRLRDTFTWDLNNELIDPKWFAQGLCIDLELPSELFVSAIVQSIEDQLEDYRHDTESSDGEQLVWVDDELRVVIRIDIIIGHIALRDQFEWDEWVDGTLCSQPVTPEQVARVLCSEKALGGEFETSIAHSIREQLYAFVKSFLLAGYNHQPQMMPRKLADHVLPPVVSALRNLPATQTFAPVIVHLHTVDAERLEKDADRESRRKRRQGRGR
ncbi:hypothetical protein BX070DRAFT_180274, partial [Coemansia spiralis]